MVLIGRRHWTGGKDGNTMAWHYLARVFALVVITVALVQSYVVGKFEIFSVSGDLIASFLVALVFGILGGAFWIGLPFFPPVRAP